MRGPDGTLDGDARALTAGDARRFDDLKAFLAAVERDGDVQTRRMLARALWPVVEKLFKQRVDLDLRETARADARLTARLAPAQLVPFLDTAIEFYRVRYTPTVVEPLTQARDALQALPGPVSAPWLTISGDRLSTAGNPYLPLVKDARAALKPFLDEDQQTKILQLVGLLPRS